jgi:hypothetical protein
MVVRDLSGLEPMSIWETLTEPEPQLESLQLGSTENTEPNPEGVYIPRELIGDWATSEIDPFPSLDALVAYAKEDPEVWKALQTHLRGTDWPRVLTTTPWALNSETILEMMLKTHFDIVNLALERTATNGKHIMIQGGKSATAGNTEAGIKSEPDRASFFAPATLEGSVYVYCLGELDSKGSKKIQNIIPGEIKLYYKFRREYLDATFTRWDKETNKEIERVDKYKREQAEQVFTQLYQYMNERNCAVGYLMTDQELICVRRTPVERLGLNYGVIDISPAIPLWMNGSATLNAKLGLWYLHHRYAVRDPHLNVMKRTSKPRNLATVFRRIRNTAASASRPPTRTRRLRSTAMKLSEEPRDDTGEIEEEAQRGRTGGGRNTKQR